MLRRIWVRLPGSIRRVFYKGGQRSDRLKDPDAVVRALQVRHGDRVADLGPGYGHFTLRLAVAVAPDGICYAADADQGTLADLKEAADERDITTLKIIQTPRDHLELPETVDLLFVSATYHHIRNPQDYFAAARSLLRPGGRVVILESRLEGLLARRVNPHGSVPARVVDEMRRAGYELKETVDVVHGHWLGVFTPRDQ
jgi:ubiquinone/menaquinone biosynthesis C-methylase UbiE